MLKQQARLLAVSVFLLDLSLVALGFLAAYWLRSVALPFLSPQLFPAELYPLSRYLMLLPLALAIWGLLLLYSKRYRSHRTVSLPEEAIEILRVSLGGAVIFVLTLYVTRMDESVLGNDRVSRAWALLFAFVACLFLLVEKLALRLTARWARSRGYNYRTVLIVGANTAAIEIAHAISRHPYWGFRVLGFVQPVNGKPTPSDKLPYPALGTLDDMPKLLDELVVDDVIFAVARRDLDRMEDLFLALEEQGIRTRFALNFFPHTHAKAELDELDGLPILTFTTTPNSLLQLVFKRVLDITISILLMMIGLPLILLIAIAIRLSSPGAVLYQQIRCGLNGRSFTLYKFRTMFDGAELRQEELLGKNEMDGPVFKIKKDPRVTRLGRLLRKFSLDELPQLWNVLRGDMSLVGPRPPIPSEVARYQRWQRRRLSMRPGLTCLWQISGRNQLDFERWIELDLEYIDSWSPGLDFKILMKTIPAVLSGRGAS